MSQEQTSLKGIVMQSIYEPLCAFTATSSMSEVCLSLQHFQEMCTMDAGTSVLILLHCMTSFIGYMKNLGWMGLCPLAVTGHIYLKEK